MWNKIKSYKEFWIVTSALLLWFSLAFLGNIKYSLLFIIIYTIVIVINFNIAQWYGSKYGY